MNEKIKRLFSLGENFMNFHTDDLVYGFMRAMSTAKPNEENNGFKEYLPAAKFAIDKDLVYTKTKEKYIFTIQEIKKL